MNRLKNFLTVSLAMIATPLWAEFQFQEELFIQWQQDDEFGVVLRDTPGGPFGPESFAYEDGLAVILDSQGKRALLFEDSQDVRVVDLPVDHPRDILMEGSSVKYLLHDDRVLHFENEEWNFMWRNERADRPINHLTRSSTGGVQVLLNMESTVTLGELTTAVSSQVGLRGANNEKIEVILNSPGEASLRVNDRILSKLSASGLGSIQYLGSARDLYYVLIEIIEQQLPLRVSREVRIIDPSGNERTRITGLQGAYTLMSKEFIITDAGDIIHMLPLKDGVHLLKWAFNGQLPNELERLKYPIEYKFEYKAEPPQDMPQQAPEPGIKQYRDSGDVIKRATVTRSQALATGESYVTHQWTASANNLTGGLITDPGGNQVQTPSWVTVGQHTKLPYKWGGFNTLAGFDSGLANGRYAGDRNTADVSSYAVSVDCSGFVSRCWNLTSHYSTWMMHQLHPLITQPLSSWDDLQPGDAIHKQGHVRLFVQKNANGTLLAVESTSREWRVSYYSYTLSALTDYAPRYYIHMEGTENMPSAISHPVLASLQGDDQLTIRWSLPDTTGLKGFHLYGKNEIGDSDWEKIGPDLISIDSQEQQLQQQNPSSWSYHIKSVNHDNAESHPSDSYTFANKGSAEKLLIVDGFDRWIWQYHDFATTLGHELAKYSYSFSTVDNDAIISGAVDLTDYAAVFWVLGNESTADESFSDAEQDLVEAYLKQGGKLFISGSEIAWDLDHKGEDSDKTFLHNYLHVQYDKDDSGSYLVQGVDGSAFGDLDLHFDNGDYGIYAVGYPDTYTLVGGSSVVMKYANNDIAVAAFDGMAPGGTEACQVLVMGFPFETIYIEEERAALTVAILDHLQLSTALSTQNVDLSPNRFKLYPAHPNPFNPSTTISFEIPQRTNISLRILDVRGREIKILVNADTYAGTHSVAWDGRDQAGHLAGTGVYFAQLQVDGSNQTIKLLYLK